MPPLLRYVAVALLNLAYLALVGWLVLFASLYLNPVFYDRLLWNASGTQRSDLTAACVAAFALELTEGWALLLLAYPVNQRLLRPATLSAARVARWAFAASGAVAGWMAYLSIHWTG